VNRLATEERIIEQLATISERLKHFATKEELQKLRVEMILWIIGTSILVGSAVISALMFTLNDKFTQLYLFLQRWKP
jgi:hypothetical protein